MISRLTILPKVIIGLTTSWLLMTVSASAVEIQTIHSSVQTYFENKDFTNSKQKDDGVVYGVGGDIHYEDSEYRFAHEHGCTQTIQPPMDKNLITDKLFLRYAYQFNDAFEFNLNYINILNDNIAITDGGVVYGLGVTYTFVKPLSINFTQFHTDYQDFNVEQSDLRIDFKTKIKDFKIKLSSVSKYIRIDEKHSNSFTKNAENDYFTSAIEFHSHYETYHFGATAYFGKRVFAIMSDGFKIQHHAMEIDRTYAAGIGKTFSDFVVRVQYIYQHAVELPMLNGNVELRNIRVILNYKF